MSTNPLNVRQGFLPRDVLKLEIERDPNAGAGELLNILPNPDGLKGAWGWTTPVDNTRITASAGVFTFTTSVAQAAYFTSDIFGVTTSGWTAAAWEVTGGSNFHRVRFEWLDVNKNLISRSDTTGYITAAAATNYAAAQAPATAVYARIRFDLFSTLYLAAPTAGQTLAFKNPRVVTGASSPIVVRANLLPQTSFEVDISGITSVSTGASAVNWPTLARVTGGAVGTWCLRSTHNAGTDDRMSLQDPSTTAYFKIPIVPSTAYTFSLYTKAGTTARAVGIDVNWYAAGTGAQTNAGAPPTSANTTAWAQKSRTLTSPSNAEYADMTFFVNSPAATEQHFWDGLMVEASNSLGTFISGTVLVSGALPASPSAYYTPISNEIQALDLDRPELDPGTLSVELTTDALDPAVNPLIRPGRKVRLSVAPNLGAPTTWEEMFVGVIDLPRASYDLSRPTGQDKTLTTFTATGAEDRLANTGQPNGVGTIANLPAVLEGAATPWNVNGNTDQVATASVVAVDSGASTLDQIVRTRDTVLGYAWVDRHGVLQAWDAASISTTLADTLDETVYNPNILPNFDTADIINTVSIVSKDTAGNEVTYGPFIDAESVRKNKPRTATFTVQGMLLGAVAAYAQQILTANATAVRRIEEVVIPITTANLPRTVRDLYELVRVKNTIAGIDANMRITSVRHTIRGGSWLMTLGFTTSGRVATPTVGTPVQSAPAIAEGVWVPMTKQAGAGIAQWMVRGGFVTVVIANSGLASFAAGATVTLVAAADGIPPSLCPSATALYTASFSGNAVGYVVINTDGSIQAHASTAAMTSATATINYPVGA